MELNGKKIAFLGDSITQGCGTTAEDKIFWKLIGQRTGAQVYGYGIGGTRIADQRVKPSWDPAADRYFASRVEEMIPDADIVVVFGGTNDFGHGDAALGTMEDRTADTFYGGCHQLLLKLIARYPTAQIIMMTPLHRLSEDETAYNEIGLRRAGSLKRYVEIIREVSEFYGIPVVDLYATCMLQPRVELLRQMYMPDGLHPNDAGHILIADRLLGALQAL